MNLKLPSVIFSVCFLYLSMNEDWKLYILIKSNDLYASVIFFILLLLLSATIFPSKWILDEIYFEKENMSKIDTKYTTKPNIGS